jgi:RNA polymerase sigma-70 factor (ECF subfamily)
VRAQDETLEARKSAPLLAAYFDRKDDLRRFFVARLGSATDADDLMQDLYLKLTGVPVNDDIRNPGAYLYRLAANVMLDRLRQQRRASARDADWRRAHTAGDAADDIADAPAADDAVAARQQLRLLVKALEDLPPQTQRVFRLHKFEGLSHAETAAKLGISRSAVEKHMIAALRHLTARTPR